MRRSDVARDLVFADLPPDDGIVTPIAGPGEPPDPNQADVIEHIRRTLPIWRSTTTDPLARASSYLHVAAVADLQQLVIERHLPIVVFQQMRSEFGKDDLIKVLYWIATHPGAGDRVSDGDLRALRLDGSALDRGELENRVAIYAAKLLRRLLDAEPL